MLSSISADGNIYMHSHLYADRLSEGFQATPERALTDRLADSQRWENSVVGAPERLVFPATRRSTQAEVAGINVAPASDEVKNMSLNSVDTFLSDLETALDPSPKKKHPYLPSVAGLNHVKPLCESRDDSQGNSSNVAMVALSIERHVNVEEGSRVSQNFQSTRADGVIEHYAYGEKGSNKVNKCIRAILGNAEAPRGLRSSGFSKRCVVL